MMLTKKAFGRILCVLFMVTVVFVFAGCSKTYKADYIEMYSEYLDYSLGAGNWTLAKSEVREQEFADFVYSYKWWSVEYTDSLGAHRTLEFDNYTGSTPNDDHFANSVTRAAVEITRDRIEKEIAPRYTENGSDTKLSFEMSDYSLYMKDGPDLPYYRPVISTADALRLYDYDTAWIFYGHRYYLNITGSFTDVELYSRAADSLYSEIRDFVGTDPDVLIDLSLVDSKADTVLENSQTAYIEGKTLTPKPKEGQEAWSWFQDVLRETYFPKPDQE